MFAESTPAESNLQGLDAKEHLTHGLLCDLLWAWTGSDQPDSILIMPPDRAEIRALVGRVLLAKAVRFHGQTLSKDFRRYGNTPTNLGLMPAPKFPHPEHGDNPGTFLRNQDPRSQLMTAPFLSLTFKLGKQRKEETGDWRPAGTFPVTFKFWSQMSSLSYPEVSSFLKTAGFWLPHINVLS